ncbi:unnamed protein product [Didymodactylos carnosus]|uniref:ADP-ribosylglycohydrolase n=1 Tax=Didymodactylos carnosus TaxID=1234261 RepID=A0A815ES48_9BILA|nr:unnamed protein product [Didymodactylos carnosus]CAF1310117.1 unnamed protein product [Didymodactylos carnosus]CAF3948298.1 unnamed protein product [Didymodactylos carnosus]CAF4146667.1 unnamed protein product [Didymodactylos carnosus]
MNQTNFSVAQWLNERKLPDEYRCWLPHSNSGDKIYTLDQIQASLIGLALGDALGAHVEFRPREYLAQHPVEELIGGGTWGLRAGQWTDDTSMALCLAASLIVNGDFNPYDQLVRYKWWWKRGYLSSTGKCFDIGNATQESLNQFRQRQDSVQQRLQLSEDDIDSLPQSYVASVGFNVNCSRPGVAGNGALMRLAPVPLFFYRSPVHAIDYAGQSARLTHGDDKAVDACRYYAALICAALQGLSKDQLLHDNFYTVCFQSGWFGEKHLHNEVAAVARGSYKKKGGYSAGIRGKGYIVQALEAALWAFWSENSFREGALSAVNLGDDADTTAAIYGQLAGAHYGMKGIPEEWLKQLYAKDFIKCVGSWLHSNGHEWSRQIENLAQSTFDWQKPVNQCARQRVTAEYPIRQPWNANRDEHQPPHIKYATPLTPKVHPIPNDGYLSDSSLDYDIFPQRRQNVRSGYDRQFQPCVIQPSFTFEDSGNPYGQTQSRRRPFLSAWHIPGVFLYFPQRYMFRHNP